MAKVFIEETTLTAIGDAIREKEGTTALVPVTDMSTRIRAIQTGGGGDITDEELTLTGDCASMFANGKWDWYIHKFANRLKTVDLTSIVSMFYSSKLESIPFQININNCRQVMGAFQSCYYLTEPPVIRGTIEWGTNTSFDTMLSHAERLKNIDNVFTSDMLDGFATVLCTGTYNAAIPCPLLGMCSLRTIPQWWYKFKLNPESTAFPYHTYAIRAGQLNVIDEILNFPVWTCQAELTSNMFGSYPKTFESCYRVKNITFETNEDGTAKTAKWKNQTIDLTSYVGYTSSPSNVFNYGIAKEKRVTNDATYQALKNDPDWFTTDINYSRYNHDSAVATINSLPDCSATGTNTIKFKGASGSKTDGGAINTLTEAEIAVATAKGWTVTLV